MNDPKQLIQININQENRCRNDSAPVSGTPLVSIIGGLFLISGILWVLAQIIKSAFYAVESGFRGLSAAFAGVSAWEIIGGALGIILGIPLLVLLAIWGITESLLWLSTRVESHSAKKRQQREIIDISPVESVETRFPEQKALPPAQPVHFLLTHNQHEYHGNN